MFKTCSKCKRWWLVPADKIHFFFQKDSTQKDGLDCVCKECRRDYRAKNRASELARWKRYYAPGTAAHKRLLVRQETRRKFGKASAHDCAFCERKAEEWHHLEYKWFAAIPLCQEHHHEF